MKMFDADKTRMIVYHVVENCDNMLSRFHLIPEPDGQTDRIAISLSRIRVLTRDKKCTLCSFYLAILTVLSSVVATWLIASFKSLANVCFCNFVYFVDVQTSLMSLTFSQGLVCWVSLYFGMLLSCIGMLMFSRI